MLAQPASGIIAADLVGPSMKLATVFRFLNEFVVLLLGALLIVLAVSGRVGLPGRPIALALLGVVLIYWGARALLRAEPEGGRLQAQPQFLHFGGSAPIYFACAALGASNANAAHTNSAVRMDCVMIGTSCT